MGTETLSTRTSVLTEAIGLLESNANVLLAGPNGSGKSHMLEQAALRLHERGRSVVRFDCADQQSRLALLQWPRQGAPAHTVLALDNLEQADANLLHALLDHDAAGHRAIGTLETGNQHIPYLRAMEEVIQSRESAAEVFAAVQQLTLRSLPDEDVAWLLHELSPIMLSSATVRTITTLAAGRPAWARDLLVLAQQDALIHLPRPAITEHLPRELNLPALRAITRSLGPVSQELATAAVISAEIGPTDDALLEDLLGARAVRELNDSGALTREPGSEKFSVPPFVAAAMQSAASPEAVAEARRVLARSLIAQDSLGLPLSSADTLRCARSMVVSSDHSSVGESRSTQVQILHRAIANSVAVGQESQARGMLLRASSIDAPLSPAQHAQVVGALVGAQAALSVLDAAEEQHAVAHERMSGDGLTAYLRAHFTTQTRGTAPRETPAEYVTALWHSIEPVDESLSRLRHLADTASPEIAELSLALIELDAVWAGRLPRSTWLAQGTPIPALPKQSQGPDDVVSGTLLLARGLTALLAGELALRANELRTACVASATPEAHLHWLRHLTAAGEALACGQGERAALEWRLLEQAIPRFTASRLRHYVHALGSAIVATGSSAHPSLSAAQNPVTPEHFTRYLTGDHTALRHSEPQVAVGAEALPVLRFARAHLAAAAAQNPVELVRASRRLERLHLWAPAAFAASTARAIYLSRRTVSGVRECDARLEALDAHLARTLPWYRSGSLPTVRFARLTRREHEVARLAARGLTNAAVAARLGCSTRTVESHLAQAKAKLGAASRQELAARMGLEGAPTRI